MEDSVYINSFITFGMASYFEKKSDNPFERHIIECLCNIYGEETIHKLYESRDESEFNRVLLMFGMSQTIYDDFLRDTVRYENFKNEYSKNPAIKTDLGSKIEISLISMFLYKCLVTTPSLEEISHFENNLLNNFEVIKIHFNTSIHPNQTRELWEKKKRLLTNNVELVEIKPELLDPVLYEKYGANIEEVKQMDYRMVEELNNYIRLKEESIDQETIKADKKIGPKILKNTVLSTGNGFVDAIIIAAIIAAEMSIGLIYLFLNL